jgi:hypothetical protein
MAIASPAPPVPPAPVVRDVADLARVAVVELAGRLPVAGTNAADPAHPLYQLVASALRRHGGDEVFLAFLRNPRDATAAGASLVQAFSVEPRLVHDLADALAGIASQPRTVNMSPPGLQGTSSVQNSQVVGDIPHLAWAAVAELANRLPAAGTDVNDPAHRLYQAVASAVRQHGGDEVFLAYLRNPRDSGPAAAVLTRAAAVDPQLVFSLAHALSNLPGDRYTVAMTQPMVPPRLPLTYGRGRSLVDEFRIRRGIFGDFVIGIALGWVGITDANLVAIIFGLLFVAIGIGTWVVTKLGKIHFSELVPEQKLLVVVGSIGFVVLFGFLGLGLVTTSSPKVGEQ